jgi:hypothetical protein
MAVRTWPRETKCPRCGFHYRMDDKQAGDRCDDLSWVPAHLYPRGRRLTEAQAVAWGRKYGCPGILVNVSGKP